MYIRSAPCINFEHQTNPLTILVYGPSGCGKSTYAQALREGLGCRFIVDEFRPRYDKTLQGGLHLTDERPSDIPPSPVLSRSKFRVIVLDFEDAMTLARVDASCTSHRTLYVEEMTARKSWVKSDRYDPRLGDIWVLDYLV